MNRRLQLLGSIALALFASSVLLARQPQKVIDRIVARVQDDIILWSDVRELSDYQKFVDGESKPDPEVLDRLIDQWIVRREAQAARFPQPSGADIQRSLDRLKRSFATAQDYDERRKQAGLSEEEIRRFVASQLYLSNYLDSRFRPLVHVDDKAIEDFYNNRVVPRAKAQGRTPPSLDAASDYIQEALIQQGINQQADLWLKESRARLQIQESLNEGSK